ncbi:MAG: hypothetical protein WCW46_01265 [Candidatus Paceibacterota bacterium]|jgi:hypothetical protein
MSTQTRDINVARDKNWVMYGDGRTVDSMPRRLDIQHYLRKAARRMKRQVSSHRQIYSEY